METKFFEIRDEGTLVPAMAVRFTGSDSWLLWRAGFARDDHYVILTRLDPVRAEYDAFKVLSRLLAG